MIFFSLIACQESQKKSNQQASSQESGINDAVIGMKEKANNTLTNNEANELTEVSNNSINNEKELASSTSKSVESDIKFIREKFKIINGANYTSKHLKINCDEMSSNEVVRKHNDKGELMYLKHVECGEPGCATIEHYYWDGALIFIFRVNDYSEGVSQLRQEYRTYFKNNEMIRCLEKEARYFDGQPPMEELLKKSKNKEVVCTPEKLTKNLSKLETIDSNNAKKILCPQEKLIGEMKYGDCYSLWEADEFNCECSFYASDGNTNAIIFMSNLGDKACVNINQQTNALYPDWEERDYKNEFKELAQSKVWISVSGKKVKYFGKPLEFYKYKNNLDFLTDVILASGKDIFQIPFAEAKPSKLLEQIKKQAKAAVKKAKEIKVKGGNDPLFIMKYDNRSYDVFVRYRNITQYEGEANQVEGTITLLQNRSNEILEVKAFKGSCGC